jgi:hypothetical protein
MSPSLSIRLSGLAVAVATLVLAPTLADARGGRGGGGGGMRASGRSSISRGGGGMSASHSMSNRSMSANRSVSASAGGRTTASRNFQSGANVQGGARAGDRANIAGNRTAGDRTNVAGGDRTRGDRTNVAGGDRTNIRGNTNINTGDINIDGDHGWYGDGDWGHHPIAAGVAFGTAAAVTSAAIGSMYYSLPPSCPPYPYGGYTYYSCGGAWYAPQYSGSSVTYVVVEDPH